MRLTIPFHTYVRHFFPQRFGVPITQPTSLEVWKSWKYRYQTWHNWSSRRGYHYSNTGTNRSGGLRSTRGWNLCKIFLFSFSSSFVGTIHPVKTWNKWSTFSSHIFQARWENLKTVKTQMFLRKQNFLADHQVHSFAWRVFQSSTFTILQVG